jgi:2',3'-cyclic-nucleotide 2'-phosphodiesterase (5'-nucleotidase family)
MSRLHRTWCDGERRAGWSRPAGRWAGTFWHAVVAGSLLLAARPSAGGDGVRLHLLFTNDIHGHVAPEGATFMNPNFPPPLGGGASAAAYIEKLRREVARDPAQGVLLVDAGDTWQGAPVGTITQGAVMEEYFNALDYDVVVPGNHEFDKGKHIPMRISGRLQRKLVCANLFVAGTDSLVDWVEPYRIVERAGLRIGIVGAITPGTKQMAFGENIAGLDFGDVLAAVEEWRDHLLAVENVDVVFAVVHEGLPFDAEREWQALQDRVRRGEDIRRDVRGAMDLAHVLEGVPVIVGGHTHRGYRDPWIDPVTQAMVFETFGNGSSLGHVVLEFDATTKTLLGWHAPRRDGVLVTLFEDEWWPEETTREKLRPFIETAQKGLDVKVGVSRIELTRRGGTNSPMGNLVTQSMLEVTQADFAFVNLGGLRADLPAGDITVGDVLRVLPFDNTVAVVRMPGRMIRQIFERKSRRGSSGIAHSGAQVVVDPDAPEGERVRELLVGGQPVEPERIYRVATTDYLLEGNSGLGFLAQTPPDQIEYTMLVDRIALQRYLERHSPVAPRVDDRWRERCGAEQAAYLRGWTLP